MSTEKAEISVKATRLPRSLSWSLGGNKDDGVWIFEQALSLLHDIASPVASIRDVFRPPLPPSLQDTVIAVSVFDDLGAVALEDLKRTAPCGVEFARRVMQRLKARKIDGRQLHDIEILALATILNEMFSADKAAREILTPREMFENALHLGPSDAGKALGTLLAADELAYGLMISRQFNVRTEYDAYLNSSVVGKLPKAIVDMQDLILKPWRKAR